MDKYRVIVTPDAEENLLEIRDYLARRIGEQATALKQMRRIRSAVKSLQTMPARHHPMQEEPWRTRGVRRFLADNYFIYYRIDEDALCVYVLNVVFARRDQLRTLSHSRLE